MKLANLTTQFDWMNQDHLSSSNLAGQCVLRASYEEMGLFSSDYLTLYGVLVTQCIAALGPDPFFRQCSCTGCNLHQGNCQELIELRQTPGRPSPYCEFCRRYVRKAQKKA